MSMIVRIYFEDTLGGKVVGGEEIKESKSYKELTGIIPGKERCFYFLTRYLHIKRCAQDCIFVNCKNETHLKLL